MSKKRIISSKKVSNKQFIELFEEYDEWVEKLIERSNQSDADLLFASMAFFTIEWKYSLEFIYLVADYMDKNGINEVDYYTLWAMALPLKYDSILGINICGDNRMIRERQYLIPDFIIEGEADEFITLHRYKYIELIGLMTLLHNIESTEGSFIGDGGTATILKFEKRTGINVGRNGNSHIQKALEMERYLKNRVLRENLSKSDMKMANTVLKKLRLAILEAKGEQL